MSAVSLNHPYWSWAYIDTFCIHLLIFFVHLPLSLSAQLVWVRLTMTVASHMAQDSAKRTTLPYIFVGAVGKEVWSFPLGLLTWHNTLKLLVAYFATILESQPKHEAKKKRTDPTEAKPDSCLYCWNFGSSHARGVLGFWVKTDFLWLSSLN